MKFHYPSADLYIPDGLAPDEALARTTHLCIAAHQDDIEIMAYAGIAECYRKPDLWFTGVVVSNGAGSPRSGLYAVTTDEEMMRIRRIEQRQAAFVGEYAAQIQLDFPSRALKDPQDEASVDDLESILLATRPKVVYTHNLADKHDTHIGVTLKVLSALRRLPQDARPTQVLGCEVWRDLDWMVDEDKVALLCDAHPNLANALLGVFDSQITGGKRYDLATIGRRYAHATYFASHGVDQATQVNFAMDLTPLVLDPSLDPLEYALGFVERLKADVKRRIAKLR
jgi:LmbE family N-acetylglucosaminyl deacetylase